MPQTRPLALRTAVRSRSPTSLLPRSSASPVLVSVVTHASGSASNALASRGAPLSEAGKSLGCVLAFGLISAPPTEPPSLLGPFDEGRTTAMGQHGQDIWLKKRNLQKLSTWWFADWNLGRDALAITAMSKSRRHGFAAYQYTPDSFTDDFDPMRAEHLIPLAVCWTNFV